MKSLGVFTTLVGGAVALAAVVVGIRSIPDVQRYLKIKSM